MIVNRSTTPSNDTRKRSLARILLRSGYRYSAVHIRSTYSMQKITTVTYSTNWKNPDKNDNSRNVCMNVIRIFAMIVSADPVAFISNLYDIKYLFFRILFAFLWYGKCRSFIKIFIRNCRFCLGIYKLQILPQFLIKCRHISIHKCFHIR